MMRTAGPPGRFTRPHAASIALFMLGACLAMVFLFTNWEHDVSGYTRLALVGALCTLVWIACGLTRAASLPARWIGRGCCAVIAALYALWVYLAVTFGILLAWTVPPWGYALVGSLAAAWAATALRRRDRPRIPAVLPLGACIAIVLTGWLREEEFVRCDDRLALQAPVELAIANPLVASCRPGEVRASGRFPRTTWEAPDGERVIFTTQGNMVRGGIDGSVCAARLDGGEPPHCVGRPLNKSQGLVDLPEYDRLLVMQWGVTTPSGLPGGVIMELPRHGTLSVLAEHWFDEKIADGFYEPRNATLYMISDRRNGIQRVRLPDFTPVPTLDVDLPTVGELRYDRTTGEGVACGAGIGAAIRGAPWAARCFRDAATSVVDKVSVSWGCDWDQLSRKVYSTVPNLGLLDRIDYDSGRVEERWFVGFGMRSVAYDRARDRVYFTNFLRGEVLAFDVRSERIVGRWFVGRFSRWVTLTRDARSLLATSNLGVVRIPLEAPSVPERAATR